MYVQISAISDSNYSHLSHSLSHDLSHDSNISFAPAILLEEISLTCLQDNVRTFDHTLSYLLFTVRDTSSSLDQYTPKHVETHVLKTGISFQESMSTTYASTIMNSN